MGRKVENYINNVSVTPDELSLLDLSEKTGLATYESRKWTLTQFIAWLNANITIPAIPTVNGTQGQIPLFVLDDEIGSNTRFTFIDNQGTEVGFRFSDSANNLTQVGVSYLNVETEGVAQSSVLRLANWSNSAQKGLISFRKARGTKASPTQVLSGDVLGAIIASGQHDSGAGTTTFEAQVVAKENYVTDLIGSYPEIFRYALTEFQILLAGSSDNGYYNPPFANNLVFRVDGDGNLYLKNDKVRFSFTDTLTSMAVESPDANDSMTYDTNAGGLTITSGNRTPYVRVRAFSDSAYPILSFQRTRANATNPLSGDILGSIFTMSRSVFDIEATENHNNGTSFGTQLVFHVYENATNVQREALILLNSGRVRISNAYTLPLADGTSGQSLITDGLGNISWVTTGASTPTSMQTIGRNSTGSTLYKGTIVRVSGSTGNRPNFVKAQANTEGSSSGTFGVVVNDIPNNSDGYVLNGGTINNLDTRSVATNPFTTDTLADGDSIYLSPTNAGYITNVKPSAPNHLVYLGKVILTSPTNGTIVYHIQNGYELEELHNVAISGLADSDILQYESSTQLWKNKPISGITSNFIPNLQGNETFRGVTHRNNSVTYDLSVGYTMNITGAQFAKSVSGTNYQTRQVMSSYSPTATATGAYGCLRGAQPLWSILGGFYFIAEYGIADSSYAVGTHNFIGLTIDTATLAIGSSLNNQPSALTNIIAVANDSGDGNLQIMHNDNSGVATKIDLGASFPSNRTAGTAQSTIYLVEFYCAPNSSSVKYRVTNKETGAVASGTITTNLPSTSNLLTWQVGRSMGTSAGGVNNTAIYVVNRVGCYNI